MKLNEIKQLNENQFLTDKKAILNLLENELEFDDTEFISGDHEYLRGYAIHADGTVDLDFTYEGYLDLHRFTKGGKLVVKFGKIGGTVYAETSDKEFIGWKSFDGFPLQVWGNFDAVNCNITSYTALPKISHKSIYASNNPITSLVGVANHFENIKKLNLSLSKITEGGLGLVMIPGLHELMDDGSIVGSMARHIDTPFYIIEKYLGKPDEIFQCQQELIDAGFEEYAKL